jgi:hypothetical protein
MTTLVVGPDEREYCVHRDLLSARSPYFAGASKDEWKEGQERRVPLPDDEHIAVEFYVQWIYAGKIFSRPSTKDGDSSELSELVGAFVFGEKVQDDDFRDAVIDSVIASIHTPDEKGECWYPTGSTADRACDGTPEGSPLRRLMVDLHLHHGRRAWLSDVNNVDFVKDLVGELYLDRDRERQVDPTASHLKSCGYHQHGEDLPCYSEIL